MVVPLGKQRDEKKVDYWDVMLDSSAAMMVDSMVGRMEMRWGVSSAVLLVFLLVDYLVLS